MSELERPIEALYRARDAVESAVSGQAKEPEVTLDVLDAFGPAIISVLNGLDQLGDVLTAHVTSIDEDEINRLRVSDDPADKVRVAAMHMLWLKEGLRMAISNATQYWSAIEHVDEHTTNPPEPGR